MSEERGHEGISWQKPGQESAAGAHAPAGQPQPAGGYPYAAPQQPVPGGWPAASAYGQHPPYPPQNPYGNPQQWGQPQQQWGPAQQWGQPPYGYGEQNRGTNGLAIASMVLGILWLFWLGSILALIFGYTARSQIKESRQGGDGMAIAGIVLGWIGLGFLLIDVLVAAGRHF